MVPALPKDSICGIHGIAEAATLIQECSITVASEVPLNDIINNRDATGRIAKWAIELLLFDITYKLR